jgi:DNA-binding CsgD family transcriptional regulator
MRYFPANDKLPAPVIKLLQQIAGAANGTSNTPPGTQVSTAYGVVTLEAKWLMPANTIPTDVAKDPRSCLIAVTIELREHALAHAARILRESGATPAQMKVGIQLALGKTKPMIADALGIEHSSVASLAKKLYQTLDIHNSTELATKIWLSQGSGEAHRSAQDDFSAAQIIVAEISLFSAVSFQPQRRLGRADHCMFRTQFAETARPQQ